MRTLLIQVALLLGVFGGDCVAQSTGQASSGSTVENITRFHPGCHARADLRGGDCLAAAHRYCESQSRNSFGFLAERVGMDVHVACAPRAWYGDVAYANLRALHTECRGVADAAGPHCAAAVRSLTGGVVQEIGRASVAVACFKSSRYSDVDYGTLSRFARGCNRPSDAGSLNCTTATSKWCKAGNAAESGLAQEVGPKSLGVACMAARTRIIRILDGPTIIDGR
jgi:hypothetical protein